MLFMPKQPPAAKIAFKGKEIGLRIQGLRKERGLTIEKLAESCNLSVQSICKIEAGRNFKVQTLISISQALGVSSDYVLGLSSYKEDDNISFLLASLSDKGKLFVKEIIKLYIDLEDN